MHELSIAQDIVEMVQKTALENHALRVNAIRLKMGIESHLNAKSLQFCLEALSQDTMLEGADISISPCQADVDCPACGRFPRENTGSTWDGCCPRCGKPVTLLPPTEIYVQEIDFDVEDDSHGTESPI